MSLAYYANVLMQLDCGHNKYQHGEMLSYHQSIWKRKEKAGLEVAFCLGGGREGWNCGVMEVSG